MPDKKSKEEIPEKTTEEEIFDEARAPLGTEVAEEAIMKPEEAVVPNPHLRYLPGDPPPGQSMFPPLKAPEAESKGEK